ncbi:MAG: tellurite resistance TerB family protein [Planctomycetota bacterium]
MMTEEQAEAIATICVLAAFADGEKHDHEREHIKNLFETLDGASHAKVYQRVMLKQTSLAEEAPKLNTPELANLAHEMAIAVCDADGVTSLEEREFLSTLRRALNIDTPAAKAQEDEAAEVARELLGDPASDADLAAAPPPLQLEESEVARGIQLEAAAVAGAAGGAIVGAQAASAPTAEQQRDKELDASILRNAILTSALELLPEKLSTVAIIAMQGRLVFNIGKAHGHSLGRGHIREFLAVAGVGMTGQVVEGFARDLFGKLAKKTMGKNAGKFAKITTSAAFTFATTYGLGQAAKQYYAGGRSFNSIDLKAIYQREYERGKALFAQHQPEVERTSRNIGPGQIMQMVRGQSVV